MKTFQLEVPASATSIQIVILPQESARHVQTSTGYASMWKEVEQISHPVGHQALRKFYQVG
ncbi:MAG: hypothetical protein AAF694_29130 [Bacteroidota bacterium]